MSRRGAKKLVDDVQDWLVTGGRGVGGKQMLRSAASSACKQTLIKSVGKSLVLQCNRRSWFVSSYSILRELPFCESGGEKMVSMHLSIASSRVCANDCTCVEDFS